MKSTNTLQEVAEFHRLFDAPILESPAIPSEDRCSLRVSLIQEELDELKEAITQNDLVAVADALTDIQFVLSGAVHEFGLATRFPALNHEVYRSNMSKACKCEEEALRTIEHHAKSGHDCDYRAKKDFFIVFRKSDNKVMKSVDYSPANLKDIIYGKDISFIHK